MLYVIGAGDSELTFVEASERSFDILLIKLDDWEVDCLDCCDNDNDDDDDVDEAKAVLTSSNDDAENAGDKILPAADDISCTFNSLSER